MCGASTHHDSRRAAALRVLRLEHLLVSLGHHRRGDLATAEQAEQVAGGQLLAQHERRSPVYAAGELPVRRDTAAASTCFPRSQPDDVASDPEPPVHRWRERAPSAVVSAGPGRGAVASPGLVASPRLGLLWPSSETGAHERAEKSSERLRHRVTSSRTPGVAPRDSVGHSDAHPRSLLVSGGCVGADTSGSARLPTSHAHAHRESHPSVSLPSHPGLPARSDGHRHGPRWSRLRGRVRRG